MRFIRSRPGLVLWCAIALLVLIVPLWRLRATRQWSFASMQAALAPDYNAASIRVEGQPEPTPAPIPYGFSRDDFSSAERRFPDEPIAQLARLNTGDLTWQIIPITGGLSQNYSDAKELAQAKARLETLYPRIWQLTDDYFAQYEELERRFPDSQLVRAQHLRDVSSLASFSDPATDEVVSPAGSLMLKFEPYASRRTLEKAIEVARAGARSQPDNAYFAWMEAIFQFALERPDAALTALEAAGRCEMFDDYTFRNVQERLRILERLRPTGWEDDVTETFGLLFPHYAGMRAVARAASWQMQLARKRKDERAAFRWAAASARAAYPVARSQRNSLICALVGEAICKIVWRAAVQDEPDAPPKPAQDTLMPQRIKDYDAFNRANATFFASIARAQGDEALARETLAMADSLKGRELSQHAQSDPGGMLARDFQLSAFHWLGAQLLRISLLGALVWCVCWGVTRRLPTLGATRAKMLVPAMFCVGVTGAILVGAFLVSPHLFGLLTRLYEQPLEPESESSWMLAVLRDYWPALIAGVWAFVLFVLPLWGRVWRSRSRDKNERQRKSLSLTRVVAALIGAAAVFGVLFGIVGAASPEQVIAWSVLAPTVVACAVAVGASLTLIWRARGPKRTVAVCCVVAFWLLIAVPFIESINGDGPFYAFGLRFGAGALILVAPFLALRIWRLPTEQIGEVALQLAARTRIAAGVLALLCAVAYLGITLWSVPVEARTRATMARQLQIGEVAWLREQMR